MSVQDGVVLVLGATGQQGGSVAAALAAEGWRVRALVRDPASAKVRALAATLAPNRIEVVPGDLGDAASLRAAMKGAYGVFSVQPSSGQGAAHGVSDADEVRYGRAVADAAAEAGVGHLVYSSANAAGAERTGIAHFDTKSEIEAHIRGLAVASTIVRPSAFMEILLLPGLGLNEGRHRFLMRPDQAMQVIAVADIGRIVAGILADRERFRGRTFEIAGDSVSGNMLAEKFSRAAGCPIVYERFPDALLEDDPLLGGLARLLDGGRLAGAADIPALRREFPGMLSMDAWLAGPGKAAFERALRTGGGLALR
ncbi:NmrA/HSCARG family protein [Arenibaculum pallidiluteum]|uniref:NmrA/HSCARG family protein n=1 Tax=Arenibaculum pallidiluteum TaxID=2812559 RepID=UPI001A978F87|nr:NmrA/HSCARG family protein [Arenibaculum pallidiluteum]